jgi:hypothetical protein
MRLRGMPCIGVYDGVSVRITNGFLVVIRQFGTMRAPDLRYYLTRKSAYHPPAYRLPLPA